ncbi:RCC1 and BTB domain-containing protein 2 [Dispira simplex]|nr:RCC1 and BTB domain-containing protein 2 [Dispira simplex]
MAKPTFRLVNFYRPLIFRPYSTVGPTPTPTRFTSPVGVWDWRLRRQQLQWAYQRKKERQTRKPWQFWISKRIDPVEQEKPWQTHPLLQPESEGDRQGKVQAASCGLTHFAKVVEGQVYTWGSNDYGQVGPVKAAASWGAEADEDVILPYHLTDLNGVRVRSVACGFYHNLALTDEGQVWSWGAGALGRGDEIYDSFPFTIRYFEDIQRPVLDISAIDGYSIAITSAKAFNGPTDRNTTHETYIWGYPPCLGESSTKYLSPALVQSLVGCRVLKATCSRYQFSVLHTLASNPHTTVLSIFGTPGPTPSADPDDLVPLSYPRYEEIPESHGVFSPAPSWTCSLATAPFDPSQVVYLGNGWGFHAVLLANGQAYVLPSESDRGWLPLPAPDPTFLRSLAVSSFQTVALDSRGQLFSWANLERPWEVVDQLCQGQPPTVLGVNPRWTQVVMQEDLGMVYE